VIIHRRWGLLGVPHDDSGTYMFYIGSSSQSR
jgi:hypothetical protein